MISMKKNNLDNAYWENRYTNMKIGWDIGYPSTPIKTYIDQIEDKDAIEENIILS